MSIIIMVQNAINKLDAKQLYLYAGITLATISCLSGFVVWYYYSATTAIVREFSSVNEYREETKMVLEKLGRVEKQRSLVDVVLGQDKAFKISQYLNDVIVKVGLESKKIAQSEDFSYVEKEGNYREIVMNVKFEAMNMKQLAELLDTIEHKERIYTKKLEIVRSKKIPHAIDVNLAIATLEQQAAVVENVE